MTKIKLCGMTRMCDIETANACAPEYIGFVFAKKSKRYISPESAAELRQALSKEIMAVGVFVDEPVEQVAKLINDGIIGMAQLHGSEDEAYIRQLRLLAGVPVIKAFRLDTTKTVFVKNQDTCETERREPYRARILKKQIREQIENCTADYVLLDSGAGSGECFDWNLIREVKRPYFLAGGLTPENAKKAVEELHPFGVDTSSGIETAGGKDPEKMYAFVKAVRG